MSLPYDSAERKRVPIYSGVLAYFPDAIAEVARVSYAGNEKHNPGQPLHWAREKSTDHEDCIQRHTIDALQAKHPNDHVEHLANRAWRALAALQLATEARDRADADQVADDVYEASLAITDGPGMFPQTDDEDYSYGCGDSNCIYCDPQGYAKIREGKL